MPALGIIKPLDIFNNHLARFGRIRFLPGRCAQGHRLVFFRRRDKKDRFHVHLMLKN